MVRKGLIEDGIATPGDFDRVFCPVGLAIGAQSVEEIAVSIVAQLVAERRKHRAAPQSLSVYAPT
jgi:xanthine dehydrogenase accessory factor